MSSSQFSYEELLQKLAESERGRREEEQRRKEEEQRRKEEEQRRKEAEQRVAQVEQIIQPMSFGEALYLWHKLYSDPIIQNSKAKFSASRLTTPNNRLRPKELQPWKNFEQHHRQAWSELFHKMSEKDFAPKSYYETEASHFMPKVVLRHEANLVRYLDKTLEQHVQTIADKFNVNMKFEDSNPSSLSDVTNRMKNMDLGDEPTTPPSPSRRFDKICTIEDNEEERPVLIVEYKAAHLFRSELLDNFGEARPLNVDDIVHRIKIAKAEDVRQTEIAEDIIAAVSTQVFDYMVNQDVSYGYVTGGNTFIFLHYEPSNPEILYYYCQTVNPDLLDEEQEEKPDTDLLRQTAVGLVAAFSYMAIPHAEVIRKRSVTSMKDKLQIWSVDMARVFAQFTPTPVAEKTVNDPKDPTYKGRKETGTGEARITRSKALLAKGCKDTGSPKGNGKRRQDDGSDTETESIPLATTQPQTQVKKSQAQPKPQTSSTSGSRSSGSRRQYNQGYCTQACLLGLVYCGPLDERCPNVRAHRRGTSCYRHLIDNYTFGQLLLKQLQRKPQYEGFRSLDRSGWSGALFWVRLISHGYTFVAKGTVKPLIPVLINEARVYTRMAALQGKSIPVYLGSIDLAQAYYLTSGVLIVHLMLMSWGGVDAQACGQDEGWLLGQVAALANQIRRLGFKHGDVRWPNVLWNEELGRIMLIDFEYGKTYDEDDTPARGNDYVESNT